MQTIVELPEFLKKASNLIPLFLLTIFGTGEKANLMKSERNELAKFISLLVKHYGGSNE